MTDQERKSATQRSFEKETAAEDREEIEPKGRRSVLGAPVDPNSPTTKGNFPPRVNPGDVIDPGRATPSGPPVDNRSGRPSEDK